jgi:hypothetical protein
VACQLGLALVNDAPPLTVIDPGLRLPPAVAGWRLGDSDCGGRTTGRLHVAGEIRASPDHWVLGYQVVTYSVTRGVGSIASRELHLRLF